MKKNKVIKIEASPPRNFQIEYWYDRDQEMPESERQHVKEMIEFGYIEGEINDDENRGWWKILEESKVLV